MSLYMALAWQHLETCRTDAHMPSADVKQTMTQQYLYDSQRAIIRCVSSGVLLLECAQSFLAISSMARSRLTPFEVGQVKAHMEHGLECLGVFRSREKCRRARDKSGFAIVLNKRCKTCDEQRCKMHC